ncbi:Pycsar system effector family protein [Egbenema bharatensis]|uniref:Pycsar system effector family protein n=1 Tax=Egbenema bharatensis TaxID=3463334 RepID=UPI003A867FC6
MQMQNRDAPVQCFKQFYKFIREMIDKLQTILSMVNEWLKYAEAKNAVLLGFSGAGFTATITYLSAASDIGQILEVGILITTLLLCICSLICSLSFLPKTNLEILIWRKQKPGRKSKGLPTDKDNLYFYGHLYKFNKDELLDALNRLYLEGLTKNLDKKEYGDLADQIIINSEIAYMKFKFFTWASYFLIAALLCTPFSMLIGFLAS